MLRSLAATAIVAFLASVPLSAQMKPAQGMPTTGNPNVTIAPSTAVESLDSARRIPRDEAIKLVKDKKAIWVDVRGKEQYDLGHIPGSISIPLGELTNHLKELPSNKMIITYCA